MNSVSMMGGSHRAHGPHEILQKELASEVAAGTINSADESALSAALDSIDSALKADRDSNAAAPPSPDEMQSKIEDLIAGQVSDGTLTSEQADELKNVFSQAFSGPREAGGKGGPGGPHGMGGPGGPPPPPPAEGDDDSASATSSFSSSTNTDIQDLMSQFLKSLQETLSQSAGYGSNGQTQSFSAALLVDYQA